MPSSSSFGWVAGVQCSNADTAIDLPCIKPTNFTGETADCGCPLQELPPEPPALPFPPTEENKERMKKFLVERYRASTFNTCQNQTLPMMHGPPMELFVQKKCTPLGVLEVVQENTPMTWCHRMVISRKHNGDPRRTVDMQKLNDVSVRQCHPTQSPLQQAMTVPHNTKKLVLDA